SKKLQTFSAFHQLDLYVEKYAGSTNLEETRARHWLTRFVETRWMDPFINKGGGRDTLGNWASAVIGNILGKSFYIVLGTEEQRARREEIRSLMRLEDYDGAYREIAQIDPLAAEKAWARYDKLGLEKFEDIGFDMESLLTQSSRDRQGVLMQASLGGAFKHLSGYMFSYMAGAAIADFGVLAVATPLIGAGLAIITRAPAWLASRFAGGFARFRNVKDAMRALAMLQRNLQFSSRFLARSFAGLGRVLDGVSTNVLTRFGIPSKLGRIVNRTGYWDAMVAAARFNIRETLVLGSAGALMQTTHHAVAGDTSSSRSYSEAAGMGLLGGATYAVKGGWMFAFMPPASAIHGKGSFWRSYRAIGESAGPVNWVSRGVAKAFGKWWKPAAADLGAAGKAASSIPGRWWAKQMWENPLGVWGYAMEKVQGMRPASASTWGTFKGVAAQKVAGGAAYIGMFTDGAFKFMLITEGVREVMQGGTYGYYWLMDKLVPREQGKSDPSAHFQRLVHAHRAGLSSMQIAFLLIPTPGYNAPRAMEMQNEMKAAARAIYQKGGKEINRVLATTADGTGVVNTKIKWYHSFSRYVLDGKKTANLSVSSEMKQWLLAQKAKGMSEEELIALISLPPVEKDAAGRLVYTNAQGKKELWMYYQEFLTFNELKRIAAGEKVVPSIKWREGNKLTIPEREDVIFLIPEAKDAAAMELNKRLVNSPDIVTRIMNADPAKGGLVLNFGSKNGIEINNAEMIKNIQNTVKWVAYDPGKAALETAVLSEMRRNMSGTAAQPDRLPFDPKELVPIFDRIWDPQVKKLSESSQGQLNNNFAKAAGMVKEVVRGKLLIDGLNDFVQRSAGKFADAPEREANFMAARIALAFDEILKLGGVLHPRTGEPLGSLRLGQKSAIMRFVKEFLVSKDPDHYVIRIFDELYASGGKTLVIKLAVIPTLSLRTRYRYETLKGGSYRKAELIPENLRRKVRFITSNETLTRQFIEDWKSYSGGQSPEFKVTSLSQFQFEELFRKERGEPSLGSEEVLVMDEADFFFGHSSVVVGEPNGHLSWGHPILEAMMRMSSKMMGLVKSGELKGLSDAQRARVYRAVARESKAEVRAAAKSLKNDPAATPEMREEAKNFFKVIQEEFGRTQFGGGIRLDGKTPWGKMREYVANKRQGQGVAGRVVEWLRDNGLETFLFKQAGFMYEDYGKKDSTSGFIPRADNPAKDAPTHAGNVSPTLVTPHGIARTLANFNKLRAENKVPTDVPWKLDLPLRSQAILTLAEIFHRLKEGGADIVLLSGTAGGWVKKFLESQEFTFLNESFATKMPERTQMVIEKGRLSLAPHELGALDENGSRVLKNPGLLKTKHLKSDPDYRNLKVHPGRSRYEDVETVKLAVYLTKLALGGKLRDFLGSKKTRPLGPGNLVHLTPRTLQEAQVWRQALIDNKVVKENEIVAFLPDFVHKGYSELRLREMLGENNVDAIETGKAKVVLNVPDIGGRGVDLPFQMYKGQIAVIGVHTHSVPIIEDIQVKNRTGHGRIPEQDRIEYIDITSAYALRSDTGENGYMSRLRPRVLEALDSKTPEPADPIARQLKRIIESEGYDPAELRKLESGQSKAFAARGDVYWLMQPMLQEEAQVRANESSGILGRVREGGEERLQLKTFEEPYTALDNALFTGAAGWGARGLATALGLGGWPAWVAMGATGMLVSKIGERLMPESERNKGPFGISLPGRNKKTAGGAVGLRDLDPATPAVEIDPAMIETLRAGQEIHGASAGAGMPADPAFVRPPLPPRTPKP
ncbi:MAG: hypothetical protein HY551_03755, partial [Elusimicrobia bacterium]|nr:hypothetical protein [Elusimicrobiota bacterium]